MSVKAYYKVGVGEVEFVTYTDTYDVAVVASEIRERLGIDDDTEITVRIPTEPSVKEVTLTDEQMQAVQEAITADGEVSGLLTIWEAILGAPLAEREGDLNPSEYAIPAAQWEEIAGYMIRDSRVLDPSFEGIPAFSMMNQGPGSFVPREDA